MQHWYHSRVLRVVMFVLSAIPLSSFLFFFNDTATTEIYTLSLHDALPIWQLQQAAHHFLDLALGRAAVAGHGLFHLRSEEHTSELQSHLNLVCRLLLEKKKKRTHRLNPPTRHEFSSASPPTYTRLLRSAHI